jgi:hypothetical protein
MLETGWRFNVSQRLQAIDHDRDSGTLDEYYLEDQGNWRVGKQYLPFGRRLLRESVLALRGDSNLLFEGMPLSVAIVDAGKDRQSGIVARVGPSSFGVSVAIGRHFGINGSALTLIRPPERFLPVGAGYGRAYGVDFRKRSGKWTVEGEAVALQSPSRNQDPSLLVSDLLTNFQIRKNASVGFGWTRDWNPKVNYWRVVAKLPIVDKLTFEPFIRFRQSRLLDINLVFRISF